MEKNELVSNTREIIFYKTAEGNVKVEREEQVNYDIDDTVVKSLQNEINNYKTIQNKYRQSCEDLTKQIYQLKKELSRYGKVYSKVKSKK